jgi:hypothetical protein
MPCEFVTVGSASTQGDLRRLQLCIDWDALAHPSDAGLAPDPGIFAAFASKREHAFRLKNWATLTTQGP